MVHSRVFYFTVTLYFRIIMLYQSGKSDFYDPRCRNETGKVLTLFGKSQGEEPDAEGDPQKA